jgi:hypothetical protein
MRGSLSSSSSSSIGACGMPGSVMLTANWSGFSISPDASLGQKKMQQSLPPFNRGRGRRRGRLTLPRASWLLLPQLRLQEPKSLGSASLNQHCRRFGDPAPVGAAVSLPGVVPGLAPEA